MSLLAWVGESDDLSTLASFQTHEMHAKLDPVCQAPTVRFSEEITLKITESLSSQTSNLQIRNLKSKWIQWKQATSRRADPDLVLAYQHEYQRYLKNFFSTVSREFCDTDLIVVSDRVDAPLPPNVLQRGEFAKIAQLYHSIVNDETIFTIQGTHTFKERVFSDMRKILTRPTGRRLFFDLVTHPNSQEIWIVRGRDFFCETNPKTKNHPVIVQLGDRQRSMIPVVNDQGKKYAQLYYSCLALGHELIHVLHHFKGEVPPENPHGQHPLYSNAEEARTITGNQSVAGPISPSFKLPYDPINENQLRRELNLPRRFGHNACNFSGNWDDDFAALNAFLESKYYRDLDWMRGTRFPPELDANLINRFIQEGFVQMVIHFATNYPDRFRSLLQDENTRTNILGCQVLQAAADQNFQASLRKFIAARL